MNTLLEESLTGFVTTRVIEPRQDPVHHGHNGESRLGPAVPRRRRWRGVLALAGLIAGVVIGICYRVYVTPYESTNAAFIEGRMTVVAPQISGRVARLFVQDNQEVKRGEVLLEIAPEDYQAQLDESLANEAVANSRLEQAKAQIVLDQAKANLELASIRFALAEAIRAKSELQRYLELESGTVPPSEMDSAEARSRSAMAKLGIAIDRALIADAQTKLSQTSLETARAEVLRCDAAVAKARSNLSYTDVVAPSDGRVMKCCVEHGTYLQPGQAAMAVVPDDRWVLAYFKKTQMAHLRPGQAVEIKLKAGPARSLKGHVDSIQNGTEHATGKDSGLVQRVPVKIVFDQPPDSALALGPGMSVELKVKVK